MGGKIVRRYRIFEQELEPAGDQAKAWTTVEGLAE
jgi:hypothetical protein